MFTIRGVNKVLRVEKQVKAKYHQKATCEFLQEQRKRKFTRSWAGENGFLIKSQAAELVVLMMKMSILMVMTVMVVAMVVMVIVLMEVAVIAVVFSFYTPSDQPLGKKLSS